MPSMRKFKDQIYSKEILGRVVSPLGVQQWSWNSFELHFSRSVILLEVLLAPGQWPGCIKMIESYWIHQRASKVCHSYMLSQTPHPRLTWHQSHVLLVLPLQCFQLIFGLVNGMNQRCCGYHGSLQCQWEGVRIAGGHTLPLKGITTFGPIWNH